MDFDVIVIGGSFAGLSAAMQLVRARRRMLLIDAGKPRNRFAEASHGFLGQDGAPPAAIRQTALMQLRRYPAFSEITGVARAAERSTGGFRVTLEDGRTYRARRLILAIGVEDILPEVDGLTSLWGRYVLHCPYCHGYEIGGGPIGLLASSVLAQHQAMLLPDWGETTVFVEPGVEFSADDLRAIEGRGAKLEHSKLVRLVSEGGALKAAELADGRSVPVKALFVQTRVTPASPLAEMLGAAMEEGPQGPYIRTDEWGATSIDGLFAAGDAASPMHNGTLASAAGVRAGVNAHRSLVVE
ncbi:NAD(P)/FAD-dependent oxidoreductase [Neorhizobium petrolearium]|uniref:NAD(P)/FAD-dependent oxidoreductase n=1 Tax=Neorhizobium petrolearium TaxID=515361 RepID=UPI001AE9C270|nr:NAD(P)/FAD-dependent oxidoreductase [Neorhizobium petrolearium]